MINFLGFAPDVDPATEGAIVDCSNVIPSLRGMKGAPTAVDAGFDALADNCLGAASLEALSGTRRVLAGIDDAIYALGSSGWEDASRSTAYTGTAASKWRFAQFGNVTIATNGADLPQYSTGGDFADITDAPDKAKIVETVAGFVMLFNINDATIGDRPDAWACSNIYDYPTWIPAESNQAEYGYLMDTPGAITAGRRLGQSIVAYKRDSMYIGTYVGAPVVWQWSLVSSHIGAISHEAVLNTGTSHLFIGEDDFYIYDGSRPASIGAPLREWFFNRLDTDYSENTQGYFDRVNGLAWWYYAPQGSGGALTEAIVYNLNNNKWGRVTISAQTVLQYQVPDMTFTDWPGVSVNFENVPDYPFDSPLWGTTFAAQGVIGTDKKLYVVNGNPTTGYIVTGTFGNEDLTLLNSVEARFIRRPSASTMQHYTQQYENDTPVERSSASLVGRRYDALAAAHKHKLVFNFTGEFEITGFKPSLVSAGVY